MIKKPEDYLKEPYSRILLPEEGGRFSAEILEFPGCFAQGDNVNEAFNNLEDAAKSWIQASLDQGLNIPPPALNQGYSGKIALRMPRSLHKRAAQFADRDATSLNQFLISAISAKIGANEYHSYMYEKIEKLLPAYNIANTVVFKGDIQLIDARWSDSPSFMRIDEPINNIKYIRSATSKPLLDYVREEPSDFGFYVTSADAKIHETSY